MKYRESILTHISQKIQDQTGFGKPTVCEISRYESVKKVLETEIRNKKHFSETDWKDCVKILIGGLKSLDDKSFDSISSENEEDYNDARPQSSR